MTDQVLAQVEGPVMVITLNKPPANAIDLPFSTQLYEAFREFNTNSDACVWAFSSAVKTRRKSFAPAGT